MRGGWAKQPDGRLADLGAWRNGAEQLDLIEGRMDEPARQGGLPTLVRGGAERSRYDLMRGGWTSQPDGEASRPEGQG